MNKTNLVELFIYSTKRKSEDGKKSWISYSTKYDFLLEDGTRATKYIAVKFTEDAFENSKVQLKDIKRGLIKVDASKVGCPDKYEVTEDKDGKKTYPTCWIRGGIDSYEPVEREHVFHFNTTDNESTETELQEEQE